MSLSLSLLSERGPCREDIHIFFLLQEWKRNRRSPCEPVGPALTRAYSAQTDAAGPCENFLPYLCPMNENQRQAYLCGITLVCVVCDVQRDEPTNVGPGAQAIVPNDYY